MKPSLLDTNLLIALLWPTHEFHDAAQRWFRANRSEWATCPITECGFVRIVSNPAFSRDAVSTQEATGYLASNLASPKHRFLADAISFSKAVASFIPTISGHGHVTDAYLLGLALHHNARVATFDQGMVRLAQEHAGLVNLIPG